MTGSEPGCFSWLFGKTSGVVIVFTEDDIGLSRYFGIDRKKEKNSVAWKKGVKDGVDILGNI